MSKTRVRPISRGDETNELVKMLQHHRKRYPIDRLLSTSFPASATCTSTLTNTSLLHWPGRAPVPAKGAPLSVLIRAGTPYSRMAASQIARTWLRSMRDDLATNQEAAMRVGDGEWIAAFAVAGDEVAFEIHAPQLIRTRDQRERL